MNVHVIGGGPAGLYFAILMKKSWPGTHITVFERNRPEDTFGFGVVFSDETLDNFEAYDRETYRQIVGHFAYWDDIELAIDFDRLMQDLAMLGVLTVTDTEIRFKYAYFFCFFMAYHLNRTVHEADTRQVIGQSDA